MAGTQRRKNLLAGCALLAATGIARGQECFPSCRKGFHCSQGACVAGGEIPAVAGPGQPALKPSLNQALIHQLYAEGEFAAVIDSLEFFLRGHRTFDRSDSIFIAKHLAVVYSANPSQTHLGRFYMAQLLDLLPSAQLVDMYVSEEIEHLFKQVRDERSGRLAGDGAKRDAPAVLQVPRAEPTGPADSASREPTRNPAPAAAPVASAASGPYALRKSPAARPEPKARSEGGARGLWIAAGTLAVGGAIGYLLLASPETETHTYNVDARAK